MPRRARFLLAVLLVIVLLAGCGGQDTTPVEEKEEAAAPEATAESTTEVTAAERTSVEATTTLETTSGTTAETTQAASSPSTSKGTAEKAGPAVGAEQTATVTRVVDGDTIEISPAIDGIEDVRLIGVDTPETKKPNCQIQPYGPEASAFTTAELQGQTVELEFDVEKTDRYDRLLAYVYPSEGTMFNETLLREGYAWVSTFPPNTRYVERFEAAEAEARAAGRGIWGLPAEQLDALLAGVCSPSQPATPPPPEDPAPNANVPEPAPDVPAAPAGVAPGADCSLGVNNVPVIPGSKGDRDKDGIACES